MNGYYTNIKSCIKTVIKITAFYHIRKKRPFHHSQVVIPPLVPFLKYVCRESEFHGIASAT